MKNSNNNQKYIAKAAYFIPYALGKDKSDEEIKALIFDTGDYMATLPEIKMLYKCAYAETKTGTIAKLTDHVDYLDRWQFEKELKEKKVKFLVIPSYPDYEDDEYDFARNLYNVFKAGIDIFDAEEHIYFNPEFDIVDGDIASYIDSRFENHCKRVVNIKEINEGDLESLRLHEDQLCCLLLNHKAVEGSLKEYIRAWYEKVQLISIEYPDITVPDVLYENTRNDIVCIEPHEFERRILFSDYLTNFCDLMNGDYKFIFIPSLTLMENYDLFNEYKHTLLYQGVIIYGLEEKKGICSEDVYTKLFASE